VGARRFRVGIDIGGTFTDLTLIGDDGALHARKLLSTPDDYGRGIAAGLEAALADVDAGPTAVERIVHGTTVATNAILEGKGARTGLITTAGFRDVLELRRLRIPEMYTLNYPKPDPLVPRRLRLEVAERTGPRGEVWRALDEASVHAAAERLEAAGVEAVAICLLHAYANPDHERRVAASVREMLGDGVFVTISSNILPEIREYERTSTTVINAYLGPILRRYFASLLSHLARIGVAAPVDIMKSDGGVMSVRAAGDKPAYLVESGPAAGVIGAARAGGADGPDAITLDMGGTTAKASIVEGGAVARTGDYEVGAGINLSSKLVMGGGYALKLPVIDISEIGAGGGSIVSIDRGGLLHVGPESAGAMPGPVAYDAGGADPTFTDAVLALGYLNPSHLVGGGLALNRDKALAVLEDRVAGPLGKSLLDAAWGVYEVACGTMVRAVKAVSTYRGRDPREFALFAFGGNGPVVGAALADLLEMRHVIVPPNPGVFSALGLLMSDIEQEKTRAFLHRLGGVSPADMAATLDELDAAVADEFSEEGYPRETLAIERWADLRYAGQAHELTVPVTAAADGLPELAAMADAYGAEHERTYGHRAEAEEVECVTLRVKAQVTTERHPMPDAMAGLRALADARAKHPPRAAYFGPVHGQMETPVVARADLLAGPLAGPVIVEEYDSTGVVPPGWRVELDDRGTLHLHRE
jgi:N-methylhydantoinase A